MRPSELVEDFALGIKGDDDKKSISVGAYEGCIPRDFWSTKDEDITHNREAFDGDIATYCKRLNFARRRGYGLLLLGPNGTGKTIFVSWILMRALEHGFSVYYTTMPDLDHNIKRGFGDRERADRLEWYLGSDFLAIDELAKERFKHDAGGFSKVELERILKHRYDNRLPTLLATNAKRNELTEAYGASVDSILEGKYKEVPLEPGDFRAELGRRMEEEFYG